MGALEVGNAGAPGRKLVRFGGSRSAGQVGRATNIVFAIDREGETHLHVMRVSPGETERLTGEGDNYAGPVCSPDGRGIAYGKGGGTYVVYYDGHNKRRVLDGSDSVERRP